jgi:hypothetical protein
LEYDENEEKDKDKKEQMQNLKKLLIRKAKRMIKIIGDIAVDIRIPDFTKMMQGIPYDIIKGAICRNFGGTMF